MKINLSDLTKEIKQEDNKKTKKALKSLRLRSFEWDNGLDRRTRTMNGWKLGLLTGQNKKRVAEVQISNVLMPFWWVSSIYHLFTVCAMSLKKQMVTKNV
jgi:hypothetical protein